MSLMFWNFSLRKISQDEFTEIDTYICGGHVSTWPIWSAGVSVSTDRDFLKGFPKVLNKLITGFNSEFKTSTKSVRKNAMKISYNAFSTAQRTIATVWASALGIKPNGQEASYLSRVSIDIGIYFKMSFSLSMRAVLSWWMQRLRQCSLSMRSELKFS